ncbi:MAG: crossover junction endodeoxyribonuclease RuvC [Thermoanaerobaculia bacterium]|nr:crossover junction endodeoxyribonuclease RuvC [Thermoanaerobaculia bacterium]
MRVLGIDPGSRFTGFGLLALEGSRVALLEAGRIVPDAGLPVPERLGRLAAGLAELLDRQAVDVAAVERAFHGVNSRSLIVLAEARGALLSVLAQRGIPVCEYAPAEVKAAVAGAGRPRSRWGGWSGSCSGPPAGAFRPTPPMRWRWPCATLAGGTLTRCRSAGEWAPRRPGERVDRPREPC